jgi:hypothetical protein
MEKSKQEKGVFARFIGPEKQGETRSLRNILIPEDGDLINSFKGKTNLKEILM